jgi:hypothetical protein
MSTLVLASQRRALRRAVRFHCQVVREHDFRLVGHRALDVSPEGMLVMNDDRILTGEDLIVTFRLPRTRLWFDVQATAARVIHGRRPTDKGHCVGLEFHSFDETDKRRIRAHLRGVPPPVPARERRVDYAGSVHMAVLQ